MSIMDSIFRSIGVSDIDFLSEQSSLYSIDFRATGEALDLNIYAMFKYENLTKWFGGVGGDMKRHIVVNDDFGDNNQASSKLDVHIARRDVGTPSLSVYDRLDSTPQGVQRLWVGVPHPSADLYAKKHNLSLNYNYKSFLERNDKIVQKGLLGDLTPAWRLFNNQEDFLEAIQGSSDIFLKKRHGAGGYGVISILRSSPQVVNSSLDGADYRDWYAEERAPGVPWSVQCLLNQQGDVTVFGVSEQYIEDETVYVGARVEDVANMSVGLRTQVAVALERLGPLLEDYVGFFGIDFIVNEDNKIQVLECNVRLTAATIPTLLRNSMGEITVGRYREDVPKYDVSEDDIILASDDRHLASDTLSFDRHASNTSWSS